MHVLTGTSGYSYKEWKGRFYPEKMKEAEMLGFYSGRFPTVEINNTFYRMDTVLADVNRHLGRRAGPATRRTS